MATFGNLKKDSYPLFYRLSASLAAAICLIFIGSYVLADVNSAPDGSSDTPVSQGKLTDFDDGSPSISFAKDGDPETQRFKISPSTDIEINGIASSVSDLKVGDELSVIKDKAGSIKKLLVKRKISGMVFDVRQNEIVVSPDLVVQKKFTVQGDVPVTLNDKAAQLNQVEKGDDVSVISDKDGNVLTLEVTRTNLISKFWNNFRQNLFKPLLLFFYVGFAVPILRVAFEFPKSIYQGLTIYLLVSIGWHGGEELAVLNIEAFKQALAFIVVGFFTNTVLGGLAYLLLRTFVPKLRKIDAATVAAYYGSDSAGTFVTCLGVLQAAHIACAPFMPVLLAVMEIPGCLVGLSLVARLRQSGMDKRGNMPDEPNYRPATEEEQAEQAEQVPKKQSMSHVWREVFFNPGLFLLFAGIFIGYVSRLQGYKVVQADDALFVSLFQGLLCLFLLEMGMTASRRLRDLTTVNWTFIAFGLLTPNLFAIIGLVIAQCLSHALHQPFQLGTYALFAVLCGSASYIAGPAVQRLAIPEASPSLPLAASLGLTFTYNVTVGIPIYLLVAQILMRYFPVT